MLASAMKDQIKTLTNGLTSKGSEPFGTQALSPKEALIFWLGDGTPQHPGHFGDEFGQQILNGMTPLQRAHLEAWLAHYSARMAPPQVPPTPAPMPQPSAPMLPGVENVLTGALSVERRQQGFPAGSEVS